MWNTWKTKKIFHDPPLNEIEAIFNQFLTADERMAALNRPSAAAPVDPRKRIATTVADVTVATKRAMIQDPRRASPSPSPIPPVSTPSPAPSSSVELQVLNNILNAPDIASRVDLQPLVQEIKRDIAAPLAPAQLKDMIAHAVQRLQSALSAGPATFTPIVAAPTMLPQPIGGLPFLPPTQPSVVAPPMPLSMPLPVPVVSQPFAAPPMSAWPQDPLMAANQTIPPPRTAREMAQAEVRNTTTHHTCHRELLPFNETNLAGLLMFLFFPFQSSHPAITFTEADLQTCVTQQTLVSRTCVCFRA